MQRLSEVTMEVDFVNSTKGQIDEARELLNLAKDEGDEATFQTVCVEVDKIEEEIQVKERELRFDGPHDRAPAIMTIQAGAGGCDAQDWAQMLERMYMRFADNRGWKTKVLTRSVGEEAGIKHSTFEIEGKFAFGLLRGEHGVHRLVRQSPFNADHLRQTSFARVEIIPKLKEEEMPEIDPKDLEIDTFRASGAGGQHVNKTSSAVRVRHLPTGITVECQNERSQGQNKAQAMAVLSSKLQALMEETRADKISELRGVIKEAAWGNQIRSYVLHPYKMVKDHRTNIETSNTEAVLDGQLDAFLESNYPS